MPDRNIIKHISGLRLLLQKAGIGSHVLILPAVLALLASVFEGLTLALLIPTLNAIVYGELPTLSSLSCGLFPCDSLLAGVSYRQSLWYLLILIFLCAALKTALAFLSALKVAAQIQRFSAVLRGHIYERYLGFGKLYFDQTNAGYLHQILATYVSHISRALSAINSAMYAVCTLVIYLLIMFSVSWQLTLIVLAIFPVLHFSLHWLIRRIARTSNLHAERYNTLGKNISNALGGITLINICSMQKEEATRFSSLSEEVAALEYSVEKKSLLVAPIQELILLCFLFLLVYLMSLFPPGNSHHSVTSFAVYLLTLRRAMALFGVINSIQASFAAVAGPVGEVEKVLSLRDKYQIPDGDLAFPGLLEKLECRALSYAFPNGLDALTDLTIYFPKGKTTALVGESGSGKSTVINLLVRLYDPPPGTIFADDTDIRAFTLASWRSRIALVSQDTYLFHESLRENLRYGLKTAPSESELFDALEKARLLDYVSQLPQGLETIVGDRGVKLSGGERQRVSIARAILRKAEILLLDEPTSALDSNTEHLIQEALDELIRDRTTIVVAHRLSTVRRADKIYVLERGQVIEEGTFESLCRRGGRFSEYWQHQQA